MATKSKPKETTRVVYKYHPRPDEYDRSWHLDKKVPIALIIAMIGQVALGASWATSMDNNLASLKEDFAYLKQELRHDKEKLDGLIELRGEIKALVQSVARLERFIDLREFSAKEPKTK